MTGLIIKGIGGFYYVESAGQVFECKARGLFRKEGITPLPGDTAEFTQISESEGNIEKICERKNNLIRPAVANIDRLFVVVSVRDPSPNALVIDRTIAASEKNNIEPVVIITKSDIGDTDELYNIYKSTGIITVVFSSVTEEGKDEVRKLLNGKISAFTGNSGVGKSSIINCVYPSFNLSTGEISYKLGRGRHTTRQVELYKLPEGGYVADTPGFSSFDSIKNVPIMKDELQFCFREFAPFIDKCKFTSDCSHTCEKGCAVIEAVKNGLISESRHKSYIQMYDEVKNIEPWQLK